MLILARILQGIGAALLTPGSLAIIQGVFRAEDRARAIGAWSGLGGIAAAIGPFVGGALVDYVSWRWIFLINLPLAVVTVVIAIRAVPETRDPRPPGRFDVRGALLASAALGGVTYALIQWGDPLAVVGRRRRRARRRPASSCVEARTPEPMLPLGLFRSRTFSAANVMTLLVYAALGAVLFFLVLQLQTVGRLQRPGGRRRDPADHAVHALPGGPRGALASRIGPRIPMTVGPLVMAGGRAAAARHRRRTSTTGLDVLPGLTVFGLGLALMVAPLTATVLAAAPDENAGIASGVNNALARAGSLLAVAALPVAVGLAGDEYADPVAFDAAYGSAMLVCAVLLVLGGAGVVVHDPHHRAGGGAERAEARPAQRQCFWVGTWRGWGLWCARANASAKWAAYWRWSQRPSSRTITSSL